MSEGKRLQRKQGNTPEDTQAFGLFHRAAEAGHAEGQYYLFLCYRDGHGVAQDRANSRKWLKRAAEGGWGAACLCLGVYCWKTDEDQAIKWFQKAVEQGVRNGCFPLIKIYQDRKNYSEALKWERRVAELG